jgi:hypothetical protein
MRNGRETSTLKRPVRSQEIERVMPQRVRCEHCGEVIGVYERMAVATDDEVRETSRAAEPNPPLESAAPYHWACYQKCFGTAAA